MTSITPEAGVIGRYSVVIDALGQAPGKVE